MTIDATQNSSYALDRADLPARIFAIFAEVLQTLNRHAERRRAERAVQTMPATMVRDLSIDHGLLMAARYAQPRERDESIGQ